MSARYFMYSEYLKKRYGEKVYKLPVSLPVTCPNRDGTCGTEGCIFCGSIGAGYENLPDTMTVTQQIETNRRHIVPKYKARRFIAYLQNFSNTYLPPEQFAGYLSDCCEPDVVGVAIATRPDCVHDRYLEIMKEVQDRRGVDVVLELGLQTVNYRTLDWIKRGHGLAEFIDATLRAKRFGIEVCAHMILNLPGDDLRDVVEGAKILSALGVGQVKLHALYVVKGTALARMYEKGEISLGTCEDYVERVVTFLEYLSPEIAIQRLIGRAPESHTDFANWGRGWWVVREAVEKKLEGVDSRQGKRYTYMHGKSVRQFL